MKIVSMAVSISLAGYAISCIAGTPTYLNEIPLDKCYTSAALVSTDNHSRIREASIFKKIIPLNHQMVEIVDRYKDSSYQNKPVKDFLSPADLNQFDSLSNQSLHINLEVLAESRLQRDMAVIKGMMKVAKQEWDNALDSQTIESIKRAEQQKLAMPDTDEGKYYIFLHALRGVLKDTEHPAPVNTMVCSLDLAIAREYDLDFAGVKNFISKSQAIAEITELKKKYNITGNSFEGIAMTQAETDRLHYNQNEIAPILKRETKYFQDLNNLRFFADITKTQYAREIEYLSGHQQADTVAMSKRDKDYFAKLSKKMQLMTNIWYQIDSAFPSMATKNNADIVKASNQPFN